MPLAFYLLPLGFMPNQIRSDTLTGAIMWSLANMGDDIDVMIQDKSLRVSSGFPYISLGNQRVHFGPKPQLPTSDTDSLGELKNRKEFKKVSYLESGILNKILSGELDIDRVWKGIGSEYRTLGSLLLEKETHSKITVEYNNQSVKIVGLGRERNEINRLFGKADNFFSSHGYLYKNAGLYFLLDGSETWKRAAVKAVRFLEDRGIGGEISIGYGQFKFLGAEEVSPFIDTADSEGIMLLSLYLPTQQEWAESCSKKDMMFYSLIRRAGRRYDGTLKREALFLGEGSIIPIKGANGRDEILADSPKSLAWGHPYYAGFKFTKTPRG